ncbi:uncharacterized protein H6S33_008425 [Morchella sextelata]|uniref:uncharacterized protein n=1 Tax=Morchella sextelata TaxID=1174677 RepID=UPI001D03EF45|nr:uncharacterized protein H6S33_008425 [Morchella sextelata]KAH0602775.1 hypothetical protein H6S33_008425 [Morchella sextelata]
MNSSSDVANELFWKLGRSISRPRGKFEICWHKGGQIYCLQDIVQHERNIISAAYQPGKKNIIMAQHSAPYFSTANNLRGNTTNIWGHNLLLFPYEMRCKNLLGAGIKFRNDDICHFMEVIAMEGGVDGSILAVLGRENIYDAENFERLRWKGLIDILCGT